MNTPNPCPCLICQTEERERLTNAASAYEIGGATLAQICQHLARPHPGRREIWNAAPGRSEGVQRATFARAVLIAAGRIA